MNDVRPTVLANSGLSCLSKDDFPITIIYEIACRKIQEKESSFKHSQEYWLQKIRKEISRVEVLGSIGETLLSMSTEAELDADGEIMALDLLFWKNIHLI